ncbi:serine/threonine-protein kinase [Nonomuraea wenchangensis]|uniref:Serine/threonine protein kinase n=1 Tax=Nonomuraea wenchangensis TaxID=568860 RepID=A0A1I0LPE9_9ACTN|nr:serine/threonine-protein kinase [Nonomuraea wenchangensis]SEU42841.1 Serine/threonine protein kinase [Nonomuraea wenchangensis]
MSELRPDDPRHLGSYRLSRRLGQGGQGVVYLGHSPQGAQVAVKLLHAGLSADPAVRRRFLGEVEAVRRVAAFCTAQLLDADLEGDRPYLVSEYVEGPSLREHVTARGPALGGSLERLAIGTATALGAIHRAGVVHRDFKPGNVLLGLDGPRVIDFGISRLVGTTVTTGLSPVGTPAYLPPERINGEGAGPPADLWAWALTVAYTASGRHAYTGETYQEVLARILFGKPDLGPLGGRLREIVEACLAREPGDRPDAEEVLRRLLGQDGSGGDVLTSGAMAALPPSAAALPSSALTPLSAATTDPAPTSAFPAVTGTILAPEPRPVRRRLRVWQVVVGLAGLGMAVAGAVYWLQGAYAPGLAGTWTGSAEHATAERVFPVELRLGEDGAGTMRWGSDLHCSGRIGLDGDGGTVYALHEVAGEACYPGTLRLLPTAYADQLAIKVTREGQEEVTYSGTVTRAS